jgi:hypothetical protein
VHYNLEARATRFEDMGTQLVGTGAYQSAAEVGALIDKVWNWVWDFSIFIAHFMVMVFLVTS